MLKALVTGRIRDKKLGLQKKVLDSGLADDVLFLILLLGQDQESPELGTMRP